MVLSHADRARIVPQQHRTRLQSRNGIVPGTLLLDGFVQGSWQRKGDQVLVRPFRTLSAAERDAVHQDATHLPGNPSVRLDEADTGAS